MAADEHGAISLFEKSIELCVASRALIDSSATLIESTLEALESRRALLERSDRQLR